MLEVVQRFILLLDRVLELLDVFRSTLSKSSLGLTIPLLPFLGCRIYLPPRLVCHVSELIVTLAHTGFLPPFLFCTWTFSAAAVCPSSSGSRSDSMEDIDSSLECSVFGTTGRSSTSCIAGDGYGKPSILPIRFASTTGASVCSQTHRRLVEPRWSAEYGPARRVLRCVTTRGERERLRGSSKILDNSNGRGGEGLVFKLESTECHAALKEKSGLKGAGQASKGSKDMGEISKLWGSACPKSGGVAGGV